MFYPTVEQPKERFFKVREGATRQTHCLVCGAKAEERRGRITRALRCPNRNCEWHRTAEAIADGAVQTHNPHLYELLLMELIEYLREYGVEYGQ
jgi:hypothetical protein